MSALFAAVALLPGLVWGWMFDKKRNKLVLERTTLRNLSNHDLAQVLGGLKKEETVTISINKTVQTTPTNNTTGVPTSG